jgi:hypothetical protein
MFGGGYHGRQEALSAGPLDHQPSSSGQAAEDLADGPLTSREAGGQVGHADRRRLITRPHTAADGRPGRRRQRAAFRV